MTDSSDRTTVTVTPDLRDRLKANRTVKEEPMRKVIERALDALEGETDTDTEDAGVTYDDIVAANRQALRDELPEEVIGR